MCLILLINYLGMPLSMIFWPLHNFKNVINLINEGHSRWITPTEGMIKNIHMRSLKTYYGICGAGHSISITPDGSIYVCQGFVGFEQYKIGTIYTGINYDKLEEFGEK